MYSWLFFWNENGGGWGLARELANMNEWLGENWSLTLPKGGGEKRK